MRTVSNSDLVAFFAWFTDLHGKGSGGTMNNVMNRSRGETVLAVVAPTTTARLSQAFVGC
jgi:hypothetical protein